MDKSLKFLADEQKIWTSTNESMKKIGLSKTLLNDCWSRLPTGGRLVANAVTLDSEVLLNEFPLTIGREPSDCLCRIAVERPIKVGNKFGWKPFMIVTQLALVK